MKRISWSLYMSGRSFEMTSEIREGGISGVFQEDAVNPLSPLRVRYDPQNVTLRPRQDRYLT
jgi:hypothetical protein